MSLVSVKRRTIVVWRGKDGHQYQSQPVDDRAAAMLISNIRAYGARLLYLVRCCPRGAVPWRWLRRIP